ncbi:MAG: ATP-dependent RNA helicase RhlE [Cyclobacteriaceae bacterium]|nr:MAG: ATP-dependent RNA helicase RhlE [Cyclobacteriaceae bacterium]
MKEPTSFTDLGLNPQLIRALAGAGYEKPTEIQRKSIPPILAGQAVIGIAQTGTGKTAAYLLPVLFRIKYADGSEPRALILLPTKELAVQVAAYARKLAIYTDIRIVELYGGVGLKRQVEQLGAGADVVVATPGRFMELYLRGELPVKQIKTLVLDEADRMMDMGFMPQLRRIFEVIPQKRQNLLFSATFPPRVEKLAEEFLEFPVRVEVTPQATVADRIEQQLYYVPNLKTKINFVEYLLRQPGFTRVLIFTRTRASANHVYRFLERKKLGPVRVIHSNKSQNTRINAMQQLKEGNLRVLVSTDVSARGIDVSRLSHVINFDVPLMYDDYVHRIGRTGRALETGVAITLATEADRYHIKKIEALIRQSIPVCNLPEGVQVEETPQQELQQMRREIDEQKKKENPEYRGAFHEKKRKY